ncbi:DUF2975 domain-containing protein [Polaribacter staleyi]|uniref:DUF2975 domain-containing protein n=1 Tax=Polaribacter staleyi TaxID=2022337 RepID=UPI0031BA719A
MEKNKLLNIAVVVCKSIRVIYIIVFIILTGIFIHLQIDPDTYNKANYSFHNKTSGFKIIKSKRWKISSTKLEDKDVYTIDKILKTSLYINYLKLVAILLFIFLATKEFQKIMQSVKHLKTFQKNNVNSFRKIGKYIFMIFLLSSYVKVNFQQGGFSSTNINFTPLFLMLIAFILAEIFKEGNLLQQENDLTI